MINLRQLDRLVIKMVKLKDYYQSYLVRGEQEQSVLLNGKPILHGQEWGEDFGYGKFTFTYKKCFQNPYLYVDNGGVENLLLHSGKPFGLTDDIPNGRDAIFRTHKYVSLAEIEEGEEIEAEAYASHTFYGTAPYAGKQTFSINGYRERRVFNKISVVDIDADVKAFLDRSNLLVSYFRCMKDGDARKIAAYQTYQALFDGISALPDTPPVAEELKKAVALMDAFFESLKSYGAQNEPFVSLIGHSHLDTAWLWTVEETRHKAVRTAANAVTLLKAYPQYRFVMSSVLYLDWIRLDYPSLFEDIRALTREGRFEPNGATWVECDCNLCDGESIVRQFLRGKRFMKQYFNYEPDVFWLPDTFGYSAALPQILKGCRVPYFLTTKLSWNDTNKFPYDSFVWRGIDGSEVLVHFNTIQSKADPEFITSRIEGRLNKHLTKNVLIAYGYGDGGGGPERSMVEEAIRTQESYPYARVAHTTVSQFMQALSEEELPVYEGELYLELHRGTLTTNHDIKRLNRALEGALKDAELLSVSTQSRAVKALTDSVYDTLMLNQFHDILPGTCIEEVHTLAIRQNEEALRSLYGYLSGDRYFNTLGFMREELLPAKDGAQSYTDFDGNTLSVDLFRFPAYGYGERVAAEGNPFTVDGLTFTTPFYRVTVQKGAISSLVFRGREIAEGLLNEIRMYE
ncbi:MAG: hypothetical protein IJF71_05060, partial [Clostridia bacterium]|nr:hypothetical protein [Clostridia bacterium]